MRPTLRSIAALSAAAALLGCPADPGQRISTGLGAKADQIAYDRGLTPDDVAAALKTYMPSGRLDDHIMFASSGHAGQVLVIGLPSMRLLRTIAVFTPEPWQGYGVGGKESMEVLAQGSAGGKHLTWGDTHHPSLSETNGSYDGEFLFIGDKANARVAVIDLRDFETKQIVKNPLATSDHGGAFVTPDTEWVVEGGQYAAPLGVGSYAPLEEYDQRYRGYVTFWKFDRKKGRIDVERSFGMELPPYWQDLADAGKGESDGLIFMNSFNVERATGGVESGNPPFEAGASQRDMDYLHIIDLKKAAQVVATRGVKINGFTTIPLQASIEEGLLHFAPEPKSPHGVDVTPGGEYAIVSGKLDPHVTIYSTKKIREAIAKGTSNKDPYGVPVLDFDAVVEAQVELGLGPLHTQFDDKGYAYTSLFLDTAVARWTLGGPYAKKHGQAPWSLVTKTPVQYNIGHLAAVEGDSASPGGGWLVAMNKWSIDRFFTTGPLLPQNFQLLDISEPGETMPVLYDMPIGVGEPHYAQIIRADKLEPWEVYPEVGWNPMTGKRDPNATEKGKERIVRRDDGVVEIWSTVVRSHFTPEHVKVRQGDRVIWHLTSLERARDATHGFCIGGYNINLSLEPGEYASIEFVADQPGVFQFYCTEFCSALHLEMVGYLLVEPASDAGKK
ncbi:MAG: Sec-dependent nitrous-oxide reductase [Planctomycetota bacterium]|nr:Sec-dependent nitrous-oxide reductase [Planctomycetota bacterium]